MDVMLEDISDDLYTISTNLAAEQPQPEQQVRNRILFLSDNIRYFLYSSGSLYDNHSFCRMELSTKKRKRERISLHWELQVTDRITIIDFSNITF